MRILVLATDSQWNELTTGSSGIDWIRAENGSSFISQNNIDAYFDLSGTAIEKDHPAFEKPVFIHAVSNTLKEMGCGKNVSRINGWNGFLKRSSWEIAGTTNDQTLQVLSAMKKNPIVVPDEPGFVSARIIAMIINEAFFAKGENVSTEKEIDIAMKLGTNYPYGPFEWASIIGLGNIYALLNTLCKTDNRYKPALLLEKEVTKTK